MTLRFLRSLLLPLLIVLSARAAPVAIQDASFDARTLNAGSWNTNLTPWQESGGTGIGSGFIERVNGFSADGLNHLGMHLNHDVWQDLPVTYQAHTRYTLTVAVGHRSLHTAPANQSQYLLAATDGSILATGSYGAAALPVQSFADAPALVFDTSANPAAVGKTIRILLRARGQGRSHFDKIRLTAVPAQPQTIDFAELDPASIGDPPFALTATASSGLAVVYTSSDPGVASVSGDTLTIVSTGSTTITARQAGNADYQPAPEVARTLTVYGADREPQTIDFAPLAAVSSTSPPFSLDATASSGLPVRYASSDPAVATVSGEVVTIQGKGTATITASQPGDADYLRAASVEQVLTVTATSQTITFGELPPQTLGNRPLPLTATASSGLPLVFTSSDPAVATVSGDSLTLVGPGTAVITADQPGDTIHEPAPPVSRNLVVHPQATALSVAPSPLEIAVRSGETAVLPFEIANANAGGVDWTIELLDGSNRTDSLESALAELDGSASSLNGPLPERYEFTGGETGWNINGGSDGISLFNQGNQLKTNLGGPIDYSNGAVASSPALGAGGGYFTRKMPGLFLFAADLDEVSWFEVAGYIQYGNARRTNSFELTHNGKRWSGFVAKTSDYWRTINHLILVDQEGPTQSTGTSNSDQKHRISGISGQRRLYYLLYVTSSTTVQPDSVFESLATRLLDTMPVSVEAFLTVSPQEGVSPATAAADLTLTADAVGISPGSLDAIMNVNSPAGTLLASVPVNIEVTEPRLSVPTRIEHVAVDGQVPVTLDIPLVSNLAGAQPWSASIASKPEWIDLVADSGTTTDPLRLRFDPESLAAGTYQTTLQLISGPASYQIPITLQVEPLGISKLVPDPFRPRVYAINKNGIARGSVLVIDSLNRKILRSIPVGLEPTDCDVSFDGARLWVINSKDPSLSSINLSTLQVEETIHLTEFATRARSNTEPGAHVKCGKGNIIYYVDEQWGPRLRVFNTATRTVLQTFGAETGSTPDTSNNFGYGDIGLNPARTRLFGWRQYGDGAGVTGSHIVRFNIQADGRLATFAKSANYGSANFNRDPYDTPVLMTGNGDRLIIKDREVDQADLDRFPATYPAPVYSLAPNGSIVATASEILAPTGSRVLASLPVATPVQSILPDLSALVYFNNSSKALGWLDLELAIGNEILGLTVFPADKALLTSPGKLEWPAVTGISRYQVYLGSSEAEVNAATESSASYLGESQETFFNLSPPPALGLHFWRVVPIGADGQAAGTGITRSFTVSNLTLSRSSIDAETVAGNPNHRESLHITAPESGTWSVDSNVPWISFADGNGSIPGDLTAILDASALAAGTYEGNITLTREGVASIIPVSLGVHAANFTIAEADLELPYVYVVSQVNHTSPQPSFLVRIDTATHQIESAIHCGRSVTDLAIHYQENRIYLTNWQTGVLRAFDRGTFAEVQTYQFTPAGAVGYRTGDIWRVAAGKKGRLILEESDQWIAIRLIDTADGKVVATTTSHYAGDGEADPTGRYYYHSEFLSSNNVTRFDVSADTFVAMTPTGSAPTGNVLMIPDGSKLAAGIRIFDPQLGLLYSLPSAVYAATLRGDLLFTNSKAYNGSTGVEMAALPFTTSVMSVTGNQENLYLFPANSSSFTVVDLSTIAILPPPSITPEIVDGATVIGTDQQLAWSIEPFALSYQVYFGTDPDAVANATVASPEYLGSSEASRWGGALPALALDGNYYWRVDTVGFNGTGKGAVWSFNVAPLDLVPRRLEVALPVSAPVESHTFAISGPAGTEWSVSTTTPWLVLPVGGGTVPASLGVDIDADGLAAGFHQGSIRFESGSDAWDLPITLELLPLNYTHAAADLEATRIYAISQAATGTDDRAFLLAIDTVENRIERVEAVGRNVTSLSIHYPENRIYVTNWKTGVLRALDRDTLTEVQNYQFNPAGGYGTNSGDAYVVAAGRAGRVVLEQEDQWINMFIVDTQSGQKIATNTGSLREGGGVFDPAGRYYFHGENNSSGAALKKYDTDADVFSLKASKRVESAGYFGSRHVAISGDGSKVFWNGGVFDPDLNVLMQLNEEVIGSTYRGEVLFTNTKAINGNNSQILSTLPVETKVQAVSGDQRWLFLFKGGAFTVVEMSTVAGVPPRGLIPGIADGSTVIGSSQELSWSQESGALSYDVFFGSSAAAVAAATNTSPQYLGNVTGTRWTGDLPNLAPGSTYYWRVDINGFSSTTNGSVWSFEVSEVDVAPRSMSLAAPAGAPVPRQSHALSATGAISWTASTSTPWITLRTGSGTTPGTLEYDISTIGLAAGSHAGSITLMSAGQTFSVPVELTIVTLNVTQLVPHPGRGVVYGINTALAGEGFSHLLEIDSATAAINRTLPIGFGPTDADLDAATGRLYVSNWGYDQTRVVDVDNWLELPSLNLGNDVYKLEVTPTGRLVTEGYDQWVNLHLRNAADGALLASASTIRQGDGQADPTGNFYYRCDSNSSGATVQKYDISADTLVKAITGPQIGYGSRNLILSEDGSRLMWLGRVMDADLRILAHMPGEVHATTRTGALAVGAGAVWWSDSGTSVATLPFEATVAAVSADDAYLLRFNPVTRSLHSTAVSTLTTLPGPWPRPGQVLAESPSRLSWSPVDGAVSYRVYIAADEAALRAMASPIAVVETAYFDLDSVLDYGRFHSWRIDSVSAGGTITSGTPQTFGIDFPAGPPLPQFGTGSDGVAVAVSDHHLLVGVNGSAQLYDFDPANGDASPLQSFTLPGYYANHYFGSAVAMDAGKAAIGAYASDNPESGGGSAYVFRRGDSGHWDNGGPLNPPAPVSSELFGFGLAASGNLMLVGTGNSNKIGRVSAYVTEPGATRVQTFSAADGVVGDGFGRSIAMEGNHAVISATGPGASYNRQPCLYAFTRSASSGLWVQTQKIPMTGGSSFGFASRGLALSGDTLAVTNLQSSVLIYTRNTSGQWAHSSTLERSAIPKATSSFGSSLALHRDQLFIGDPQAVHNGVGGGVVFSFRRLNGTWIAGPVIVPDNSRNTFGNALAARDGWLLAAGGDSQPAWLFHIDASANRIPRFIPEIPVQAVIGRALSTPIRAEDADGNFGLAIDKAQGPAWLNVTDNGNGNAVLGGTPAGSAGDVHTVQLRVRDVAGAEALHTYQLTLLTPDDLPSFAREPSAANLGVGQELVLRAAAAGIGPFQWQWYRDGMEIEGATSDRYFVAEVELADIGQYAVRVSNAVGEIESSAVDVAVRPADRFAGGWPTFGGSPAHTGRHPATLDSCVFLPAWNADVQAGSVLNRAAIADGRAFVVPQSRFATGTSARALDLKTGGNLWVFPLPSSNSTNPPSVHDGKVYFQRGKGTSDPTGPQLFSLDAETGTQLWASGFGAQWESYEAPAVTDLGIFINGGTYGGMYGFNFDGSERFFAQLPQYDRWTPTIWNDRLFSWVEGRFAEHGHGDGSVRWSVDVGWDWSGWSMASISAISDNSAVVIGTTEIACIDLPTRSVRWRVAGTFRGSPGIAGERAFAILGDRVVSYSLADGTPDLIYQTDAPTTYLSELIDQPILFNDRLVIANPTKTWIFDLESAELLQTLNAGGRLSYSDGFLLAAGNDGVLRAFEATPNVRLAIRGPDGEELASGVSEVRVGAPSVGEPSLTRLILQNTGQADLEFSWQIRGANAADFAITNEPDQKVEGFGEAAIDITFTPSAKGRRTAVITISSNDPTTPEFDITLYADPPELHGLAASDISGVSAVLNGAIQPNADDLTVSFHYGLSHEYGSQVAGVPLALTGDDEELVSAAIDGLTPGTTYYYRVGATTTHGTHWSDDVSFTTLSDNAVLAGLSLNPGALVPGFETTRTQYIATVPFATSAVSIVPVTDHPGASVRINGNPVSGGSLPIELAVGNNTLTSVVTAEDGMSTMTYTIIVTRLPLALAFRSATDVPVTAGGFAATGITANFELGYAPDAGTSLTVVNNTGLEFISGNFTNFVHGQRITLDYNGSSYEFVANYFGGDGNDLVLHWADTELVVWGSNTSGQLGDATTERRLLPTAVSDDGPLLGKTLLAVSGGYLHSLALAFDGTLAAWGYNAHGQLGNNSGVSSSVPVVVDASGVLAGRTVVAISAGPFHNLALCSDGTIAAWGYNNYGQLGTGDKQTSRVPVLVKPVGALAGKRVVALAAGSYHSFAICSDGSVAAWGYNDEGELGDGTAESTLIPVAVDGSGALSGKQVASISAGQYHALALCTDGTLVTWGYNKHGQLGTRDTADRASPVEIGSFGALAGKTVVATAAGGSHSLALCSDGTLFAWGHNDRNQLGTVGISHSSEPLAVAMPHSASGRTIAGIAAGWHHNLVRFSDGGTSAWGGNANGELGGIAAATSPDAVPVDIGGLPAGARFISAASGSASSHNLAIMAYPNGQTTAIESWRYEHFGSTANEGEGADDNACSHDGIPNLVKYAFGLDPRENAAGRLPQARMENGGLVLRFTRPAASLGVVCGAEWSDTLEPGSWKPIPDTGSAEEHLFNLPMEAGRTRFMRLKVTAP